MQIPTANLVALAALSLLFVGCNPGQCLRQSDCPLGSTCKEGICRTPSKSGGTTNNTSSAPPQSTTARTADDGRETQGSTSSTDADPDAGVATISGQSSNLDSVSDTSSTVGP